MKTSGLLQVKHFDKLLSSVKIEKKWNVLDIGCGTGNNTIRLANMVGPKGKVVGIDPIAERIELAKENNCASNIEYHVGHGQDIEKFVKDQKFDLVIAGTVMHWIPPEEKPKVFKSVFDQLKSGRIFLFNSTVDLWSSNLDRMFDLMKDQTHKSNFYSRFYVATIAEYELMAANAGFIETHGRQETTRDYFESEVPIIELLASSIHTLEFDVVLSELRGILNNDDIDKSFDEEGRTMFQVDQFFIKCCKQ